MQRATTSETIAEQPVPESDAIEVLDSQSSGYSVKPSEIRGLTPGARSRLSAWIRRVNSLRHIPATRPVPAAMSALANECRDMGAQLDLTLPAEGGVNEKGQKTGNKSGCAVLTAGTFELRLKVLPDEAEHREPTAWQLFRQTFDKADTVKADPCETWLRKGCGNDEARAMTCGVWTLPGGVRVATDGSEIRWSTGGESVDAPTLSISQVKWRGRLVAATRETGVTLPDAIPLYTSEPFAPFWTSQIAAGDLKFPGETMAVRLTRGNVDRVAVSGEKILTYRKAWPSEVSVYTGNVYAFDLERLRKIVGKDSATLAIGTLNGMVLLRVSLPGDRVAVFAPLNKSHAIEALSPDLRLDRAEDEVIEALESLAMILSADHPMEKANGECWAERLKRLDAKDLAADEARAALAAWLAAERAADGLPALPVVVPADLAALGCIPDTSPAPYPETEDTEPVTERLPVAPVMVPVKSSNLDSVGYSGSTLRVRFKSGAVYDYANVEPEQHSAMLAAPSIGGYFSRVIRKRPDAHPFVMVCGPDPKPAKAPRVRQAATEPVTPTDAQAAILASLRAQRDGEIEALRKENARLQAA